MNGISINDAKRSIYSGSDGSCIFEYKGIGACTE
jgi:hypothetical protein